MTGAELHTFVEMYRRVITAIEVVVDRHNRMLKDACEVEGLPTETGEIMEQLLYLGHIENVYSQTIQLTNDHMWESSIPLDLLDEDTREATLIRMVNEKLLVVKAAETKRAEELRAGKLAALARLKQELGEV